MVSILNFCSCGYSFFFFSLSLSLSRWGCWGQNPGSHSSQQVSFLLSNCFSSCIQEPWFPVTFFQRWRWYLTPQSSSFPCCFSPLLFCRSSLLFCGCFTFPRLPCPWDSQARTLEWVTIPFSRRSSQPRDWTQVSHPAGRFFTIWATREAPCLGQGCFFIHPTDDLWFVTFWKNSQRYVFSLFSFPVCLFLELSQVILTIRVVIFSMCLAEFWIISLQLSIYWFSFKLYLIVGDNFYSRLNSGP